MPSIAACSYAPPNPTAPTTVVLVSGGVDSTVLLYQLAERRRPGEFSVYPLFIDYAQRAAELEHEAAAWHCRRLCLQLQRLDISRVGEAFRRARSMKPHIPLPHRNLVALSLALSYVAVVGATAVALGVIRDDIGGYASASLPFLDAFGELAQTLGNISLETPFVHWPKAQVIAEGNRLGVDFVQTYSCMLGRELHCGHCTQCLRRDSAFRELLPFPRVGS
jgi:7-cyano-7-deazaguanine synthase